MRNLWFRPLVTAFVLVVGSALVLPRATYAATNLNLLEQFGTNATCGTSNGGIVPNVSREGITEKSGDVVIETEVTGGFVVGHQVNVTFTPDVDMTSPVDTTGGSGGVLPGANVIVCDSGGTLSITPPNVSVAVTILGHQITVSFIVLTADTGVEAEVILRNLRWNMTALDDGDFLDAGGQDCPNTTIGCPGGTAIPIDPNFFIFDPDVPTAGPEHVAHALDTIAYSFSCDATAFGVDADCDDEATGTDYGFGLQNANGGLIDQTAVSFAENFFTAFKQAVSAPINGDIATTATTAEFTIWNVPAGVTVTMPAGFIADPLDSAIQFGSPTGTCTGTGAGLGPLIDCTYQTVAQSVDGDDEAFDITINPITAIVTGASAGSNTIVVTIGAASGFGTAKLLATFGPDSTSGKIPRYIGNPITFSHGAPTGFKGCSQPGSQECSSFNGKEGRGIIHHGFFDIFPVLTDIVVPWVTDAPAGWDTGIAVSNTGLDNFGCPNGAQGCAPSLANSLAFGVTGPVTVTLFPQDGSAPVVFTTGPGKTPGAGLSANGTLSPGQTWSIALSTLLAAAGVTTPKAGYMLIQTGFLYGHAAVFDFTPSFGFADTPVIVLPFQLARPIPIGVQEPQGQIARRKH